MNGLVMIGHKQDTDSEDESGDLSFNNTRRAEVLVFLGCFLLGKVGGGGEDELPEK